MNLPEEEPKTSAEEGINRPRETEDEQEKLISEEDSDFEILAWNLAKEGDEASAVRNFEAAADHYAEALEMLVEKYGDLADPCAELYVKYGKTLLTLANQEKDDLLLGKTALEQVSEG
jgi:hypothetical protein